MENTNIQGMGVAEIAGQAVTAETAALVTESQKPYVLRDLCAKDIFPMTVIIRKIGLKDVGKCFDPDEIRGIMASVSGDGEEGKEKNIDDIAETVGISVVLKIVDVILENLASAEQEIFGFLGGLSGMTAATVGDLPMDVFFEMLVDVFKKKEFVGFMKVVSKLLK